jgi:hypothetical protein
MVLTRQPRGCWEISWGRCYPAWDLPQHGDLRVNEFSPWQLPGSKNAKAAGHWWLMSVILATQEAEIKRIEIQNQPRQIVFEALSQKNPSQKKGWCTIHNSQVMETAKMPQH